MKEENAYAKVLKRVFTPTVAPAQTSNGFEIHYDESSGEAVGLSGQILFF